MPIGTDDGRAAAARMPWLAAAPGELVVVPVFFLGLGLTADQLRMASALYDHEARTGEPVVTASASAWRRCCGCDPVRAMKSMGEAGILRWWREGERAPRPLDTTYSAMLSREGLTRLAKRSLRGGRASPARGAFLNAFADAQEAGAYVHPLFDPFNDWV